MALKDDLAFQVKIHLDALAGAPEGLAGQLGELAPVLSAFEAASGKIEVDANLTAVGRANALHAERDKATAAITTWTTGKISGIDAQIEAQRAALAKAGATGTPPTEFTIRYMAERLVQLDPLEVEVLYHEATEQERLVIEAAVEALGRVPRRLADGQVVWEHLMNPDRIASSRAARSAKADPAAAARLADANRIRNTYEAVSSAAVSLLGRS